MSQKGIIEFLEENSGIKFTKKQIINNTKKKNDYIALKKLMETEFIKWEYVENNKNNFLPTKEILFWVD